MSAAIRRILDRLCIFSSLVSNTLNECPCQRYCRGLRGRFSCGRSLGLRLLFSFFAPVVLPRLLSLLAPYAFVLRQIVFFSRRCLLAWYCCSCCRRCGVGIIWRIEFFSWNRSHQDGSRCEPSEVFLACLVSVPTDPKSWRS